MNFLETIRAEIAKGSRVIIPDIKCYSPKDGDLFGDRNPVDIACALADAGACVLSVVTEKKEFHGSMELLAEVWKATKVPILRKDFIHTWEDLIETREAGASAILLMCSCLTKDEMVYLYNEAKNIGLVPFVETHSREEMEFAKELGAELIGVNNRNILQLERDDGTVATSCDILPYAPGNAILVSESSLMNAYDVECAIDAGADCALVGTAIMKAPDPVNFYRALCRDVRIKVCGLMRKEDVDICMENGIDMLGFVCGYPKDVPWNISVSKAQELIKYVPPRFKTCVVTGGSTDKIIELAGQLHPDAIQLHYEESGEEIRIAALELHKMGIEVIKSIPVGKDSRIKAFGTDDAEEIAEILCGCGVDAILIDARDAANAEQYGLKADTGEYIRVKNAVKRYDPHTKVIIAGGITPDNVFSIVEESGSSYIDVMTGVESDVGIKSGEKVAALVKHII